MGESRAILFSELASAALPGGCVSEERSRDRWQAVRYETAAVRGTMLLAGQETFPPPVTVRLNLTGWHRLYVCLADIGRRGAGGGIMYTYLKLTGDRCPHGIIPGPLKGWSPTEQVEESLWRCADLTGKDLIVSKPASCVPSAAALVWVRCVPMTDAERAAYEADESRTDTRTLHAHIDTDFIGDDDHAAVDDYLIKLQSLRGSDVSVCSQEVFLDHGGYFGEDLESYVSYTERARVRAKRARAFHRIRGDIYRAMLDCAHDAGIRLYAAQRMNIASFGFPFCGPHYGVRFSDAHPEYAIVTRDGRRMAQPSYAYPDVQDYVIRTLLEAYQYGFDGVTLIWTRGIHVGFEPPVANRVREAHPGVDPCALPAADERLHGVWCEILSGFMRTLRVALDEVAEKEGRPAPGILADVFCDIDLGKQAGLDVERWAKEGLVTGVIQDNMAHFEDLTGCGRDDDPARIDLDRYREQLGQRIILSRRHGNEVTADLSRIAPFAALKRHGGGRIPRHAMGTQCPARGIRSVGEGAVCTRRPRTAPLGLQRPGSLSARMERAAQAGPPGGAGPARGRMPRQPHGAPRAALGRFRHQLRQPELERLRIRRPGPAAGERSARPALSLRLRQQNRLAIHDDRPTLDEQGTKTPEGSAAVQTNVLGPLRKMFAKRGWRLQ